MLDGFPLRIQYPLFQRNMNFCLHLRLLSHGRNDRQLAARVA
jgi:hypothetical protein